VTNRLPPGSTRDGAPPRASAPMPANAPNPNAPAALAALAAAVEEPCLLATRRETSRGDADSVG